MSNFVDDVTPLAFPKQTLRPIPSSQAPFYLRSEDWNDACQALYDVRGAIVDLREETDLLGSVPANRVLGSVAGGAAAALTGTQVTSMLDAATASAKGVVPAHPNDATKVLRGDLTWGASPGGTVAGSLSISLDAMPPTVNLTTEGTIDWFAMSQNNQVPRIWGGQNNNGVHAKAIGGWIHQSFEYIAAGDAYSYTMQGSQNALTCDTADDVCLSPLTAFAQAPVMYRLAVNFSGWGYRYRCPVTTVTRTNKLYAEAYAGAVEIYAYLTDGSAAPVSILLDPGGNANIARCVTITAKGSTTCELVVVVRMTDNRYVVGPNIKFCGATLG